jgi:hypothetical protein
MDIPVYRQQGQCRVTEVGPCGAGRQRKFCEGLQRPLAPVTRQACSQQDYSGRLRRVEKQSDNVIRAENVQFRYLATRHSAGAVPSCMRELTRPRSVIRAGNTI